MDTRDTDQVLRELYRHLEPRVREEDFCETLGTRLSAGRRAARRNRALSVGLLACLTLVVVVGLGVGIYEAAVHLGRATPVVVITDDSMSPRCTGSLGATQGSGSTAEEDASGLLSGFVPRSPDWPCTGRASAVVVLSHR